MHIATFIEGKRKKKL